MTFGLGTSTSSAATTFYVDAAVDAGSTQRFAGTLLAVAAIAAIVSRITAGIACDRMASGHLRLCAGLLVAGAVGLALLSSATPALMSPGIVITLAGSWGINGVFWFALIRAYPDTPGRITGVMFPGALLGSTLGPIAFGIIADTASYPTAWAVTAVVALTGAVMMVVGARRLAQVAPGQVS